MRALSLLSIPFPSPIPTIYTCEANSLCLSTTFCLFLRFCAARRYAISYPPNIPEPGAAWHLVISGTVARLVCSFVRFLPACARAGARVRFVAHTCWRAIAVAVRGGLRACLAARIKAYRAVYAVRTVFVLHAGLYLTFSPLSVSLLPVNLLCVCRLSFRKIPSPPLPLW